MDFAFLLKKTLSVYLNPVAVTLELLFLGFVLIAFSRRRPKTPRGERSKRFVRFSGGLGLFLIATGMLFLFLVSIDPVAGALMHSLEKQHPPLAEENGAWVVETEPDYIVVLANGARDVEGRPELSLLPHAGYLRITSATRMWKQFPKAIILVTGTPAETAAMKLIATRFDVPEASVMEENQSRDTKDHSVNVKKIIGDAPFLLVTSGAHMPRAFRLFTGQGLKPTAAAVDLWVYPELGNPKPYESAFLIPRTANLYASSLAMHELMGMAWALIRGQVGDVESVSDESTVELSF